jgi:peptide/nickel transport system permease protein
MALTKFIVRRFLNYAILAFIATSLAYILASSLLHPQEVMYPPNLVGGKPVPHEVQQAYFDVRNINPDVSVWQRYLTWLTDIFTKPWDEKFGVTTGTDKKALLVMPEIVSRVGISLRLIVLGTLLGVVAGVALGAWSAVKRGTFTDRTVSLLSFVVLALPTPVIILCFQGANMAMRGVTGFGFPSVNAIDPNAVPGSWDDISFQLKALVLPTLALALMGIASYSRYMKVTTLDVLGADYLRTARAKGLTKGKAMRRHGFRMALIPMGQYFAYAFAGAFVLRRAPVQLAGHRQLGPRRDADRRH